MTAQRAWLGDGRLHLQHGPIDIVIGADGASEALQAAHAAAWARFQTILPELVSELALLRAPVGAHCPVQGVVAQRMWQACHPYRTPFITAMAAVAGSVAQELLPAYAREGVDRAWINNGGDIALHLTPGQSVRIGLYADLARLDRQQLVQGLDLDAHLLVDHDSGVRGVATSGWRGRSVSLGIADSVTVLAATAAQADAAATVIANAVNVVHPGIVRVPAHQLRDDCDLGALPVTVEVPRLPEACVDEALRAGWQCARALRAQSLVIDAFLTCQGRAIWASADDVATVSPMGLRNAGALTHHAPRANEKTLYREAA